MMTTNVFVIANVKQLRTDGSFRILLPFCRTSLCFGFLNSAMFNSFHHLVEFGMILEGLRNFGGGLNPRYATDSSSIVLQDICGKICSEHKLSGGIFQIDCLTTTLLLFLWFLCTRISGQ